MSQKGLGATWIEDYMYMQMSSVFELDIQFYCLAWVTGHFAKCYGLAREEFLGSNS